MRDQTTVTDLHESLIINIFIFLPLQFIIRCSCVCKQWANLISQPYFIQPYYKNQSSSPCIHFLLQDQKNSTLFFAQLDESSCTTAYQPPDFIVPKKLPLYLKFVYDFYPDPSWVSFEICTTCTFTGFVVADAYDHYNNVSRGQYHVFNPITTQHFLVKQINNCRFSRHLCALVFVQKTKQLKLLSFYFSDCVKVDIQTIGTKSWRSLDGSIPFHPTETETQYPTFANGFYHWIGHWKQIISSFDPEKEVFQRVPTPATIRDYTCSNLGVLDGFLCICMKSYSTRSIEFWIMNEYGIQESWTRKFVLHCEYKFEADRILEPMRCLENGEIVVICRDRLALCYNPTTRNCKYIKFDGEPYMRYRAFPYVPSLRRIDGQRPNRKRSRYLQL